jgi:para-aminobenzoate synthetase / 4-amino-4-deoxychorismate lyase
MDHALEPDPVRGVFSTLLAVAGRPVELDPHLAQLRESVRALYGIELPSGAAELVVEEARSFELARVRLTCWIGADGVPRLKATARAVERAVVLSDAGLDLRTSSVDGWHGAHKWVDRRLLERLEAAADPAGALLVERDGRVLETTRANVFALGADGVLRTPPADGSILPGVTRAIAIALAGELGVAVREEALARDALLSAREVFATGSIRGVEPVRSLDGAAVGGPSDGARSELAGAIAELLRQRWLEPAAGHARTARA